MLLQKEGYPEESELVICTITKIQYNSVFATLDEYGKTGMIHISEISPGRIRNIRDYVKEGKVVVCVALKVSEERGYIDLSLRRVNESQRKNKINEQKKEQAAEKIIEFVATNLKLDVKKLYIDIMKKIQEDYDLLADYFEDVVAREADIKDLKLDSKVESLLITTVEQRVKLPEVEIVGRLSVTSFAPDGVEIIKKVLTDAEKTVFEEEMKDKDDYIDKITLDMIFLGGGKYELKVTARDYKRAEKIVASVVEYVKKNMPKSTSVVDFQRKD